MASPVVREVALGNDEPEKLAGGKVSRFQTFAARLDCLEAQRPQFAIRCERSQPKRGQPDDCQSWAGKAGDEVRDWREEGEATGSVGRSRHSWTTVGLEINSVASLNLADCW